MQGSTRTTTKRRILALLPPGSDHDEVRAQLGIDVDIRIIESPHEAFAALRDEPFDLVVTDGDTFGSLERSAIARQAAVVLESIGQGVCIVDGDGRLDWANPVMRSQPEDLIAKVCEACARSLEKPRERDASSADQATRRISLCAGDDQYFEVSVTALLDEPGGHSRAAAVVWDVTGQRRLQKKLDAIDLAGRELSRLDAESTAGMNIEERFALLERKIFLYMHDLLHFDDFAVLLLDKTSGHLEMVLQHGMSERTRELDIVVSPENNGISGYVAAIGRSYICPDTTKDPRYLTGLESARSSLTVPLRLQDKVIGVFDIESDKPAAFDEDDRQFAEILAGHIAMALNILDLLVIERYESTGRLADDVNAEIAGPLNDIITEAATLKDEYIGNDDLRRRLGAICDNVAEIKEIIKEVASPKVGVLGRRGDTPVKDPTLAGKRVLVADDEEIIRETVGGVLRRHGCVVQTARDGGEAIEILQQARFDLIIADIKMPNKNGYQVFAAAKEVDADVPVMLMTGFGYDPNHSILRARREGLSAVLFKPFKVDQLVTEARNAVQARA